MEWYDLMPGDVVEINSAFDSETNCTDCLGFNTEDWYIIEEVRMPDGILHANEEGQPIELVLRDQHRNTHAVLIAHDGAVVRHCIHNRTPIFRLVALAEE